MIINIDKKAEEYIKSKSIDKAIQIVAEKVGKGWCQHYEPSVKMGKPSHENAFNLYQVGDISVYVLKWLKSRNDEIRITLNNFLFIKTLYVDGITF